MKSKLTAKDQAALEAEAVRLKKQVAAAKRPKPLNIADMGFEHLPGTHIDLVFADGKQARVQESKPVPFSRVGAPDHVHAPRVPDGVTG